MIIALFCGIFLANPAFAAPLKILAYGDSLTAGYGLAREDGFTARLEKKLQAGGYEITVVDGGVSGDTTAGGLSRIDWMLAEKPDFIILELGANDMLRGIDPAVTRDNLDAMLKIFQDRGIPVLLAGMKSFSNLGADYAAGFSRNYAELAAAYQVLLYPFFMEGVAFDRRLLQDDGLHPNAQGVDRIVEGIYPYVEKLIKEEK